MDRSYRKRRCNNTLSSRVYAPINADSSNKKKGGGALGKICTRRHTCTNRETSLNRRSRRSIGQVYRVPPYIYILDFLSYPFVFFLFSFFFFTVLRAATPPPDIHRINEVNYCLKSSISIPSKRNNPPKFPFDFSFVSPSNRFLSNRMNNTMLRINFSNRVKLYAKIYFVT